MRETWQKGGDGEVEPSTSRAASCQWIEVVLEADESWDLSTIEFSNPFNSTQRLLHPQTVCDTLNLPTKLPYRHVIKSSPAVWNFSTQNTCDMQWTFSVSVTRLLYSSPHPPVMGFGGGVIGHTQQSRPESWGQLLESRFSFLHWFLDFWGWMDNQVSIAWRWREAALSTTGGVLASLVSIAWMLTTTPLKGKP